MIPATKIIFPDFDGPLSNVRVTLAYGDDQAMDPVTCRALNHICEASGAKIVCTSTRAVLSPGRREETLRCFEAAGLDIRHIHHDWSCNTDNGGNRYEQIEQWRVDHPEVTHYVIIDDESVRDKNGNNHPKLVKTSMYDGFGFDQYKSIAALLDFDLHDAFQVARKGIQSHNQLVLDIDLWDNKSHNARLIIKKLTDAEQSAGHWHRTTFHPQLDDGRMALLFRRHYPGPARAFKIAVDDVRADSNHDIHVRHGARVVLMNNPPELS